MNFEKHKLENTETEVDTISLVYSETVSEVNGESEWTEETICAFLTLKEAENEAKRLNESKHSPNITYKSYCIEIKSGCQHPKEAISENAYGDKQCCKCRQWI